MKATHCLTLIGCAAILSLTVEAQHLMLATPFGGSNGTMEGVGDVDGDGIRDIAVGGGSGVKFYSGNTGALLLHQSGLTHGNPWLEVGDMNADGVDDLIIGDDEWPTGFFFDPGQVVVLSSVTLLPIAVFPNPNPPTNSGFGRRVHFLEDMDGDSIPELGVYSMDLTNWPTIVHVAQVISGSSGIPLFTITDVSDTHQGMTTVGDLNLDGVADILVVERTRFAVFAGGTWSLLWSRPATLAETPDAAVLGIGDATLDGVPDWALRYYRTLEVISGSSGAPSLIRFLGLGPVYQTLDQATVDLDGNGVLELVSISHTNLGNTDGPFFLHTVDPSSGALSFMLPIPLTMGQLLAPVRSVPDLNGDGVDDIVARTAAGAAANLLYVSLVPLPIATTSQLPTPPCPGVTAPSLTLGPPVLGTAPTVTVLGSPSTPAILALGLVPPTIVNYHGCSLGVDLQGAVFLPFMTDATGVWTASLAIPGWTTIIGAEVAVQAALASPSPGGVNLSNAVRATIGL